MKPNPREPISPTAKRSGITTVTWKTPQRLLILLGSLAVAAVGGYLFEESRQLEQRKLATLEENLAAEATLLAEHAELTFSSAVRLLLDIEWDNDPATMREGLAAQPFYQRILRTPQFAGLMVTDAAGESVFTANRQPIPARRVLAQPLFAAHRAGEFLAIGEPFSPASMARRLIPVSQRLSGAQGEFAGVAVVLLDSDYFHGFYDEVSRNNQYRIGMFHRDGTVLAMFPSPGDRLPGARGNLAELFAAHTADVALLDSPLDGEQRIIAYRNLVGFPLAVTVSRSYPQFREQLRPDLLRNAVLFLVFAGGTLLSVVAINATLRAAERARESQQGVERRHQETLQLCHAIARNLPNGRVFVVNEALRYEFVEGRQWSDLPELVPTAMIGRSLHDIYPPEVARLLEGVVTEALAGREADTEIAYRERVFRAFATPLRDETGTRCLLLSQDITDFKANQSALEIANRELDRLASTDALLGISNRRHFDATLGAEWQRARRYAQPLSLLLIDVDHFKRYNDAYGHPAGDVALRQVAEVVNEAVARPGDLVARYGGEELVVLLPGTPVDGALAIAQRIHRRLARRAVAFAESPVAGHLTVSIGVATSLAESDSDDTANPLIQRADEALYRAKAAGRNRSAGPQSLPPPES